MQHGEQKYRGGDEVERLEVGARLQDLEQRLLGNRRVRRQVSRKLDQRIMHQRIDYRGEGEC
jgi:hypothetical protein